MDALLYRLLQGIHHKQLMSYTYANTFTASEVGNFGVGFIVLYSNMEPISSASLALSQGCSQQRASVI